MNKGLSNYKKSTESKKQTEVLSIKPKSSNNPYQINIISDNEYHSRNQQNLNFKKEKTSDFTLLNRDTIKSRQYSTNKESNYENSIGKISNNVNGDVNMNEYLYKSKEKSEDLKIEKNAKTNLNELQHQQIELYQNNKREIEILKNDQNALQEKYYKMEKNYFEIEDVKNSLFHFFQFYFIFTELNFIHFLNNKTLHCEKEKNIELQKLFDDQRNQNRKYMKEISEREQMLEKIEFMNQVLQEKEQELLISRSEIPKKEKIFEENMKNLKFKYENQIKSLEKNLENFSQEIEKYQEDDQVL